MKLYTQAEVELLAHAAYTQGTKAGDNLTLRELFATWLELKLSCSGQEVIVPSNTADIPDDTTIGTL